MGAARYHVNPSTGNPGSCRATQGKCPFGGEQEHFDSAEAAREAFEKTQGSSFDQPMIPAPAHAQVSAPDPRRETENYIDFVAVEKLKAGEEYEGEKLTAVKAGRKWVTLTTPTRKEILLPLGEKVAVQRERATAAANKAEREHQKERMIKMSVEQAQERFDKALADLSESIASQGEANSFRYDSLITAQEDNKIWQSVHRMAERQGISYSEALNQKVEQIKEGVFEYGIRSGTSRSTSVVSNLLEDAANEAKISFVRDQRWW